EKMQEKLPDAANMLLLMRDNGTIRFYTHAAKPEPRAGDTILSFSPPQARSAEEKAAKKAAKNKGVQPT
ncbi:MAG: sodium:proton antiporter, partial [Erythrobacter sp.]|nr:sodium:proton antiporter [Erythrobacter sp.]